MGFSEPQCRRILLLASCLRSQCQILHLTCLKVVSATVKISQCRPGFSEQDFQTSCLLVRRVLRGPPSGRS
jgi:hypothetical protein